MVDIPNRDYRFMRMMKQAVSSVAPPSEYQNVGIVCIPSEKRDVYLKIIHHIKNEPRPMFGRLPDYVDTLNGVIFRYIDTNSSISLLSEPEDFHMRTLDSIYIVSDTSMMNLDLMRDEGSAILNARVNVNLAISATYNWR